MYSVLRICIGFNTDPDLHWFQCGSGYGSGSSIFCQCGSGYISKVLMTKNWKKFTAEIKFNFFYQKLLSLGLHKGRPSYRRSLHPSKENI
jgi:hypothetical protein